jgi:hypothetical protein
MQESHSIELRNIHPTIVGQNGLISTRISRSCPVPVSIAPPAKGDGEIRLVQSIPFFETSANKALVELVKFFMTQPFTKNFALMLSNGWDVSTLHPSNRNQKLAPESICDWILSELTFHEESETRPLVVIACITRTPLTVQEQTAQQHTKS